MRLPGATQSSIGESEGEGPETGTGVGGEGLRGVVRRLLRRRARHHQGREERSRTQFIFKVV